MHLAQRWQELRAGAWSDSTIQAAMSATQDKLGEPATRTLQKWSAMLPGIMLDGVVGQIMPWLMSIAYGP